MDLTFEALGGLLAVAGAVGTGSYMIWREVSASRQESQDGRRLLYDAIARLTDEISRTYVRQDVYAAERRAAEDQRQADLRVAAHRDEEVQAMLKAMSDRTCPLGRDRQEGH